MPGRRYSGATEREIIMCIGVPVQVISPGQWFAKC
ncbi:hydrogenase formation protein, partial [Salmonella enterica]|nr:hydrogenase formation protein [Salmonella enterica]